MHLATKVSLFVLAYGMNVLQPTNLAFKRAHLALKFNKDGENLAKKCEQVFEMTKLLLEKAQKCCEEQVNFGRHVVEYEVG